MLSEVTDAILTLIYISAALWGPILAMGFVQRRIHSGFGPKLILIPASVGVPVHEASHYLMAKLMGHKVLRVCLFQPMKDGTLGFVEHSYRRSWISPFTNLMIGMAPLAGGVAAFISVTLILVPDVWLIWKSELVVVTTMADALNASKEMLAHLTRLELTGKVATWVFVSLSVLGFMLPSKADFDGALTGIGFTSLGLVIVIYCMPGIDAPLSKVFSVIMMVLPIIIISNAALLVIASILGRFVRRTGLD